MKIYNISEIPEGLRAPSYEEVLLSGYTDGYEDGYNNYVCYDKMYLTIEALENGSITIWNTLQYSINDGPWQNAVLSGNSIVVPVNKGDVTRFKGINAGLGMGTFRSTALSCIVYGNIMSLVYGDGFIGKTELNEERCFYRLFSNIQGLKDASNLILPAISLTPYCYDGMFHRCYNLVGVPELPATNLAEGCYNLMFGKCESITSGPKLPATTLERICYMEMFRDCKSLITAPELPATTLAEYCYYAMFGGCTSLTTGPELQSMSLEYSCYYDMFRDCTNLTTAPELPATTLVDNCYTYMFYGCTSLNNIKCLATDISASSCIDSWVEGVSQTGTFVKNSSMSGWTTGVNGIPSGWTVVDAT